ncbi:MAG: hypothetical protein OER56_13110 [Hyphomicrobiales bacterium]|nr:hypothetical protein [Hyphomicrobiales bacterium]
MRRLLLTGAALVALTTSVYAGQCPGLIQKVDEALSASQLAEADKAKVMELRNQGEAQHAAGQHAESVASLNEALQALGQ